MNCLFLICHFATGYNAHDDRYCVAQKLAMDGMAHARIVIGGVLWVLLTGVLGLLIAIIYNRQ